MIAAALLVAGALAGPATAAPTGRAAWALEEHALYQPMPDVTLTDADGATRALADWSSQVPLLLTFAYARCTGVCSPLLRNLAQTTRQVDGLGQRYRVVVVDLDPTDKPQILRAFAKAEGATGDGWSFTTASADDVTALVSATGGYARPVGDQIDHPAMVAAIRNGRLVQAVAGADFSTERLAVAVREAEGSFIPVYPLPGSNTRLRCFHYQASGPGFGLDWGAALLVVPGALALVTTTLIFGHRPAVSSPSERTDRSPTPRTGGAPR